MTDIDRQLAAIQAQAQAATRPEQAVQTANRAGLLLLTQMAAYAALPPVVLASLVDAAGRQLSAVLTGYRRAVERALPAGRMRAATFAVHDVARISGLPVRPPVLEDIPDLGTLFDDAEARVGALLDSVQLRIAPEASARAATAATVSAVRQADSVMGDSIHKAYADASHTAAEQHGVWRIWKAERNACATCLAYAGAVVEPGQLFPDKLTYGDRPMKWRGFTGTGPPRHPHCRCIAAPIDQRAADTMSTTLRREAQRSIIKGFALPSESVPVRARAAERLLRRGSLVPKSVQEAAARALANGEFITKPVPRPTIK